MENGVTESLRRTARRPAHVLASRRGIECFFRPERVINRWTAKIARALCCDVLGAKQPESGSCSTMDSAPVSEAGDVGSIPAGSTNFKLCERTSTAFVDELSATPTAFAVAR